MKKFLERSGVRIDVLIMNCAVRNALSAVTFALGAALVGRWLDAVPDFPHGRGDSGCGQIRRFQPLELLVTSG